jgi:hypothetical protein
MALVGSLIFIIFFRNSPMFKDFASPSSADRSGARAARHTAIGDRLWALWLTTHRQLSKGGRRLLWAMMRSRDRQARAVIDSFRRD